MSKYVPPKHYKMPEWAKSQRTVCIFTVEEQERIIANAGRVSVNNLAKLMQRNVKSIRNWARSKGIAVAVSLHRPHHYPAVRKAQPPRKPVEEVGVERMMELAFRRLG